MRRGLDPWQGRAVTVPGFPTARDPMLSLLQSAAARVARRRGVIAGAQGGPHPLVRAADRLVAARHGAGTAAAGGADQAAGGCVGLGLELLEAVAAGRGLRAAALRARLAFSACDPLWAETLLDYARGLRLDGAPRPVPYVRYQAPGDFVVTAPAARARVALVSDWGTGTDVARAVAALMAAQRPDVVIHLGDIYFAATAEECALHFLQPLRAVLPDARLFTLCGNHDVYGGGQGYYGLLREIGQPASYFCLRSPDRSWQILAADTGLHDRDPFDVATAVTFLDPLEELWHADKLRGHAGLSLFLTHHPPFSAYARIGRAGLHDPTNPALLASHARLAAAGPIDAWFWGHEHVLRLYAPYRGVAAGRTIGYGAIPVAAPVAPLAGLADPPALAVDLRLDVVDGASTHGFALLECGPDGIEASYWALTRPDGPIHRERFGADRSV